MAYLISNASGNMCDGEGFSATVASGANYISCQNITQLSGASTMSFSFWAKKTSSTDVIAMGKLGVSGDTWGFYRGDGTLRVVLSRNTTVVYADYAIANDTDLHHYLVVFDGGGTGNAGRLKLYIDGSAITFDSFSGTVDTTLTTNTGAFAIGRFSDASTQTSAGSFAQVDVFTTALSSSDATTLYNSGAGLTDASGITGHLMGWRMREGAGATAYGYGLIKQNGTYTGTVTRSTGLIYDNTTKCFGVADATANGTLDSEAGTTAVTTSQLNSATFSPTAGTVIDAVAIKIATIGTSASGTFTVHLRNTTDSTNVASVTVNCTDLQYQTLNATSPGWAVFKFSSPYTTVSGKSYAIGLVSSVTSQITCYTNGTANNWSRMYRTTTTQCPKVADSIVVTGEHTGAGTYNAIDITGNNLEPIIWGSSSTSVVTSIAIGSRGKIKAPTSGGRNFFFGLTGQATTTPNSGLAIGNGGVLEIGTPSSPMDADTTFSIPLLVNTNVDTGVLLYNGGSIITGDAEKTRFTYLTADASAGATSITVNDATGWRVGDEIVPVSSTRTYSQTEKRTITSVSGNTIGVSALTNAHSGTAPTQCYVMNISRNGKIYGSSASLQGYVVFNQYPKELNIDGLELYWMGSGTTNKRGLDYQVINTQAGTANVKGVSTHDFIVTSSYGLLTGSSMNNTLFEDFMTYNVSAGCVVGATSGIDYTFNNIYACTLSSGVGVTLSDLGGTYSGNIYSSCAQSNNISFAEAIAGYKEFGTVISHSSTASGMLMTSGGLRDIKFAGVKSWRNGGTGITLSGQHNIDLGVVEVFGNTTDNILLSGACSDITIRGGYSNGDTTFSTTNGIRFSSQANQKGFKIMNFDMSTSTGIRTAHTNDINIATVVGVTIDMVYCKMGASVEVATPTNMSDASYISSQDHDQSAGSHKMWTSNAIWYSDSDSWKVVPSSATKKTKVIVPWQREIGSGATRTISADIRCSVSGDGAAYNGTRPRLVLLQNNSIGITDDTVLDTATASSDGAYETLTGTSPSASQKGGVEAIIDNISGTTGWVNIDNLSIV